MFMVDDKMDNGYYKVNGIDPLTAFREGLLSEIEYKGFLKGNIIKYICRCEYKNKSPISDLVKAGDYLNYLVDVYENDVVDDSCDDTCCCDECCTDYDEESMESEYTSLDTDESVMRELYLRLLAYDEIVAFNVDNDNRIFVHTVVKDLKDINILAELYMSVIDEYMSHYFFELINEFPDSNGVFKVGYDKWWESS